MDGRLEEVIVPLIDQGQIVSTELTTEGIIARHGELGRDLLGNNRYAEAESELRKSLELNHHGNAVLTEARLLTKNKASR